MEFKNFKSAQGNEVRVALTSGHVWIIGREWRRIPEFAWSSCYAEGCVSEDMFNNSVVKELPETVVKSLATTAQRKDLIKGVLQSWVDESRGDKFTIKGFPKTPELQKELPFKVTKNEVQEVWYKLQEEIK